MTSENNDSKYRLSNRPFLTSLVPLFQSESKCEIIPMKMTLICMKIKLHAELIVLKERCKRTRKWPNCIVTISRLLLLADLSNEQSVPVIL